MFCTNCGHPCEETDRFCIQCGTTLTREQPLAASIPDPEPVFAPIPAPTKKGRLRVPIIIMCLLTVIGLSAFFIYRAHTDPAQPWFTVRNGTLTFDTNAFNGGSLNVPSSIAGKPVTKISTSCFLYSTTVSEIKVSEGVEEIGALAFAYSTGLRAVSLPDSVTSIGMLAFAGCPELEAIRFGPSVEHLDSTTFMECPKLRHIFFHGTAQQWEAMYADTIPERVTVYLVQDGTYTEYTPAA